MWMDSDDVDVAKQPIYVGGQQAIDMEGMLVHVGESPADVGNPPVDVENYPYRANLPFRKLLFFSMYCQRRLYYVYG